ncbi:hypothetical protein EDB85DRAFT_1916661 [Lactarius pseudohatsudake]|nr:hypothetical protein EDB85DRAFT_1916661 [Lactarius pseudohatsudake]
MVEAEKAQEQISRQRAADKAAREKAARAANASASSPLSPARGSGSGGSSWFSKIASAIIPTEEPAPSPKSTNLWNSDPWSKRQGKNATSPNVESGPPKSTGGSGAPVHHSPTTSSNPHGSAPTHIMMPITAAQSSTSVVSSSPTLVSQEHKPINDKQGGKAGDGKAPEAATVVPDETTVETAADKTAPSKTAEAGKTGNVAGGAAAPDASGDKSKDESTQAQKTEEVVDNSEPNKDTTPASTAAAPPANATPPPPVPKKDPTPANDATVTEQHTPVPKPAASASTKPKSEPEAPKAPAPDAKRASETPAHTEGTQPAPQPSQNGKAGDEKPTTTKDDDAKQGGSVKPALRLDHIRATSTASTMSASSPGTPTEEAPSSSVEKDDDLDPSGAKLTKAQKKRIRDRARKQAQAQGQQKGEKNSPRPPSGATSNSVDNDNSVVQELKPVVTASVDIPVDIPAGEGDGVLVDTKTGSGEDDAPVIVEKPDAAATTAEQAA